MAVAVVVKERLAHPQLAALKVKAAQVQHLQLQDHQ
jgi:hypothetical protein